MKETNPTPADGAEPTPRTNNHLVINDAGIVQVPADFARTLERELASLRRERDELREKLKGEVLGIPCDVNTVRWAKTFHEADEQLTVLRSALEYANRRISDGCVSDAAQAIANALAATPASADAQKE